MTLPLCDEIDFSPANFAAEFAHDALLASGGSHSMWLGRALSLLHCLRQCAADEPGLPPGKTFSACLALEELHRRRLDAQRPAHTRAVLGAYLNSLPGYDSAAFDARLAAGADPCAGIETAREQHGYLSIRLGRIFSAFAEVFDNPALAARRDALPQAAQSFLRECSIFTPEEYFRCFPCLAKALALSERIELREALPEPHIEGASLGSCASKSL